MESQGGDSDDHKESQAKRPLIRQNSPHNLKLDDIESHLEDTKPLNNLNLDEQIQYMGTFESTLSAILDNEAGVTSDQSALQHQASISLTSGLSEKTVDEVWIDKQDNKNKEQQSQEGQTNLGDAALEELLVETGMLVQSLTRTSAGPSILAEPNLGPQFSQGLGSHYPQALHQHSQGLTENHMLNQPAQPQYQHLQGVAEEYMPDQPTSQPAYSLNESLQENLADVSKTIKGTQVDAKISGRKRGRVDPQTAAENKLKRMIKNRELSTLSRERKQAYLNDLERRVTELKVENAMLRKLKKFEDSMPSTPKPRYQLRRTSSI